jgi:pimeloyl-ACP methyl ester carboxylesterase
LPSAQEQASYLSNFRADSIVEDAEAIRAALVPETAAGVPGKWTVLGQSFGGFCLLTYLSRYSEALEAGLFTGGLAPLATPAATVYRATYKRCAERNRYFPLQPVCSCLCCQAVCLTAVSLCMLSSDLRYLALSGCVIDVSSCSARYLHL